LVFFAGCRKKQLSPAEIRAITRELISAAKNATSGKAEIGMRPEYPLQPVAGHRRPGEPAVDHIYITLPAGASQADASALMALETQLDRVAASHDLARKAQPGAPGLVRFDYRRGDQRTHAIHIITPLVRGVTKPERGAQLPGARLAIIIDDLGYDRAVADALFALPFPLTVAVLPNHVHSADIAEEAHRRGYQVLLHLPMESNGNEKPEAAELRVGMTPAEAARLLAEMLEPVPHAVGVNNHQGSLATADAQLMAAIMSALRERQLFFIDSRTTTATLAYDSAVRAGVPAAFRNVPFLDDTATREAVRQQLALAVRHARQHGFAIAIGHPHAATLQTLEESLPQLEGQGVRLVFTSELVR
jgi:polysaccharide deacetylase 2 family uncharacterized protein YibQ